ncbi:hypothetical protein TPHA_0A02660 [Tetrapisispora phaffii CBS 4417]|uniref:Uncharacterized protein n=1 Tax=Tetrapisispora phaffii (strain ATCC 24235 / CBS 4417 / NBRC 1672 / NRRL Y-8282 / UCD 70-5) TaxID=1071381 RepID=G8BN70_TETPH|nr:hypothetical protein TPHA_0A02660 [Tetrapisispora phaffii CBS 4417]CCE61348.1 hypothetical protein TPHA_0A02660 [Tetrapisispora phaffii CBS 4417]
MSSRHEEELTALAQLLALCESHRYVSRFDPMLHIVNQLKHIALASSYLIENYKRLPSFPADNIIYDNAIIKFMNMNRVLESYSNILMTSINLIFDYNISTFRSIKQRSFIQCILTVLSRLEVYNNTYGTRLPSSLKYIINEFKYEFEKCYRDASLNIIKFNQTIDLTSFTNNIITSPSLTKENIIKRENFKLTSSKLNIHNLPVEVCLLDSKQFTIFKINKCSLLSTAEKILDNLLNNEVDLSDIGRTLLFPVIRSTDLRIIKGTFNSLIFETNSGNGLQFELKAINVEHWESYWKHYFYNYFQYSDHKNNFKVAPASLMNTPNTKFYEKYNKLKHLKEHNMVQGIGISLESSHTQKNGLSPLYSNYKNCKSLSSLHRSKPLSISYSSSLSSNQQTSPTIQTSMELPSPQDDSLESITIMSYDKLKEFDESINVLLSPKEEYNKAQNIRSVSSSCSLERIDSNNIIEHTAEEVYYASSIISSESIGNSYTSLTDNKIDSKNNSFMIDYDKSFLTDTKKYEPNFYSKKKSTSLLSFFNSKKNKKNLAIDTSPISNDDNSIISSSTSTFFTFDSTESPSSTNAATPVQNRNIQSFEILEYFNPKRHTETFNSEGCILTMWNKNRWQNILTDLFTINIFTTTSNLNFLLLQEIVINTAPSGKLLLALDSNCRFFKSTAKDIQIRCTNKNVIKSCASISDNCTFTIRCNNSDLLLNALTNCLKISKPSTPNEAKLTTSHTLNTISTTSSSFFSRISPTSRNTNYSTDSKSENEDLIDLDLKLLKSRKLLSLIKVKHHTYNNINNLWEFNSITHLSIYSQEYEKEKIALKFQTQSDITDIESKSNMSNLFVSYIDDVKRLGRTGISLIDFATNRKELFEFQNNIVTNDVYSQIL